MVAAVAANIAEFEDPYFDSGIHQIESTEFVNDEANGEYNHIFEKDVVRVFRTFQDRL